MGREKSGLGRSSGYLMPCTRAVSIRYQTSIINHVSLKFGYLARKGARRPVASIRERV